MQQRLAGDDLWAIIRLDGGGDALETTTLLAGQNHQLRAVRLLSRIEDQVSTGPLHAQGCVAQVFQAQAPGKGVDRQCGLQRGRGP